MTDKELLDRKRKEAANKIKSVAPHVDMLINMLDETKIDMILIALAGARITNTETD